MTIAANENTLKGRRLLVVEDEMLLAMDLEMLLEGEGCVVLGPAHSVAHALDILKTEHPDAATLDMNLNGELSVQVAAALRDRKIPFVVVTGYTGRYEEEPIFQSAPLVKKPYDTGELIRKLIDVLT